MDKTFYKILAVLAAFGAIGAAYVGLQFLISGAKSGDFQNALLPALVAFPCIALASFARGKATTLDSATK